MAPNNSANREVGDSASSSPQTANENVTLSVRSKRVRTNTGEVARLVVDGLRSRCFINPCYVSSESERNNRRKSSSSLPQFRARDLNSSFQSIAGGNRGYPGSSTTLPDSNRRGRSSPFSRCSSRVSLPENRADFQDLTVRPRSSHGRRQLSSPALSARSFFIRRAPVRLKPKQRIRRSGNAISQSLINVVRDRDRSRRVEGNGDAEPRPTQALASATMPNADGNRRHRVANGGSGRGGHPRAPELPPMGLTTNAHLHQTEEFTQIDNGSRGGGGGQRSDALPDILHSHLPPPYSTLPPNDRTNGTRRLPPPAHPPPPPPHLAPQPVCHGGPCPPSPPPVTSRNRSGRDGRANSFNPFAGHGGRPVRGGVSAGSVRASAGLSAAHHHHHAAQHHHPPLHGGGVSSEGEEPKHCCGVMVTQSISIRWFIVMIAFVGLCCAIVGTVLGALKATGREHLTVSLLMIGVGIVLITVSGIAWRLTSHDAPSCRAMLGLQPSSSGVSANPDLNRRFLPRVPPYGRPPHPYAAMLYPEFQYRPPPPSYQASMQEYRLRLLLLDRQQGTTVPPNALSPVSPPPTYRSHASSTLHSRPPLSFVDRDYSRPPSYRSRASSVAILRGGAPHASSDTLDSRLTRNDTIGDLPDSSSGCNTNRNANTPGTNTPSSAFMPGTPPSHSHSRDPSLTLSYLSHESLMFNDSAHSALPLSSADIARSMTDRSTLDRSTLERPPLLTSPSGESRTSVTAGLSDDSPVAVAMPLVITPPDCWTTPSSATELRRGSGSPEVIVRTGNKHPDINTVTIVQTTDSSQVRNQDTVIVAVTGTQQVIPNPNRSSGLRNMLPSVQMQLGPDGYKANKNEVQILAQV